MKQIVNQNIKLKIIDFILNVFWKKKDILDFCKNTISENFNYNITEETKRNDIIEAFFNFIDTSPNKKEYYKKIILMIKEWNLNKDGYWYQQGKLNFAIAKSLQMDLMLIEINDKKQKTKYQENLLSINNIKNNFYSMINNLATTPQQKGFEFEKIFYQIAELEKIECSRPYRVPETNEQIDGHLKIENNNYLVELKLTRNEINYATLSTFQGKLSTKGCYPRGIFLSMDGFTDGALLNQLMTVSKNIILMDSTDFINILEGRIKLEKLLVEKINLLQTKGYFYYDPVSHTNKYDLIINNKK